MKKPKFIFHNWSGKSKSRNENDRCSLEVKPKLNFLFNFQGVVFYGNINCLGKSYCQAFMIFCSESVNVRFRYSISIMGY